MGTVRRLFVALAVVGVATASLGADAHGFNAASASLTMSSPSGDYIGGGQNYSYTTANNDAFTAGGSPAFVEVSLLSHSGDWWTLDFAAPSGGALTPNTTYDNANRYPFQGTGPGLSVNG